MVVEAAFMGAVEDMVEADIGKSLPAYHREWLAAKALPAICFLRRKTSGFQTINNLAPYSSFLARMCGSRRRQFRCKISA